MMKPAPKPNGPLRNATLGLASLTFLTMAASPAFAHHAMGGVLPSTFAQGLISGIAHPIIGVDHLAFIIGVGLMAAFAGARFLLPLAFIVGTLGGAAVHFASLDLPVAELVVALSVAAAAVAVIARAKITMPLLGIAFAGAGLFHGYAYAESIVGAQTSVVGAYLVGFGVTQYTIALAAGTLFHVWSKRDDGLALSYARVAGGAMAGVAAVALSSLAFPV